MVDWKELARNLEKQVDNLARDAYVAETALSLTKDDMREWFSVADFPVTDYGYKTEDGWHYMTPSHDDWDPWRYAIAAHLALEWWKDE